jgi:hypothetical protein
MLLALVLALQNPEEVSRFLEARCAECHNAKNPKGGLDLTTREALMKGGETGASIVPGKPDESAVYRLAAHLEKPHMPHKREKLPAGELDLLRRWVADGAPYARALKPPEAAAKKGFSITEADRKHWAFLPLRRPEVPPGTSAHPIDRFIDAKLGGVPKAPLAPRKTLLRRVTLDLTGLPPGLEEAPEDWAKVVDGLLASPRYGERWGRHWLDLARYAETDGFEHDATRPHAWRYRDYVIRAFNDDKPYDQFVKEQIAGDELWPGNPEALVATGFNLLGPDMVDSSDQVQRRLNTLSDMTDITASVFLGLTLGCARCHDHKFEPLAQKDYYKLMAFFTSAAFKRDTPVPTAAEKAACDAEMERFRLDPRLRELDELEAPIRGKLREKKIATLNDETRLALATPPEKRDVEQANLVLETEPALEVAEKDLAAAIPADRRARRKELVEIAKKLKPPQLPLAMTLLAGKPAKTHVLHRGEYAQPGEEVRAGFPEVLGATPAGSRRSDLAAWLADPANPLSARVMVNRIWQHHFGRGLAPSPSEFGPRGQPPTHPELLDWLASEFIAGGWSLKALHRLILSSEAYRRSSVHPEGAARDPENLLLGRMNRLRLEGEVIRDSLLSISGRLHEAMGGPGVFPPIPSDVLKGSRGWTVSADPKDHRRRSVYIFARRNLRFPFLEVFDAPDSNLSCPERGRSTTAPQSLTLLNAEEVVEAAKAVAEKVGKDVEKAYRLVLGRRPTARETELAEAFLRTSPPRELIRALFNLNAFVYAE